VFSDTTTSVIVKVSGLLTLLVGTSRLIPRQPRGGIFAAVVESVLQSVNVAKLGEDCKDVREVGASDTDGAARHSHARGKVIGAAASLIPPVVPDELPKRSERQFDQVKTI